MTRFHRPPFADVSSARESEPDPHAEESTAFVLVAHGPPIPASEVESNEKDALMVRVLWDRAPLAVHYLESEGSVVIGDHEDSIARIPESALGAPAFEVARATTIGYLVRVPAGVTARVGKSSRATEVVGPREWETSRGDAITMTLGSFCLEIVHGCAGRTVPPVTLADRARESATFQVAGAALLHGLLFTVFAYYAPSLVGEDDATAAERDDRIVLIRHYLGAAAERERERVEESDREQGALGEDAASGGARAAGAEGAMGKHDAHLADQRWGKLGPRDNPSPSLGRSGALLERGFEWIGIVADSAGASNAPTAPWGNAAALGVDPLNALGNMWGRTIGEAAGMGGLGLSGVGEGGGWRGEGVGLDMNDFGGISHWIGPPGNGGIGGRGSCPGCQLPGHAVRTPSMRPGTTVVGGHVPPEVIQRVVRDNFGRFRNCYEAGLRENPSLEGRVVTRFAIDRQGVVTVAQDGGSSLPNASVVACVVRSFYSLTFPEHEGGIVTVVYPLALRPE